MLANGDLPFEQQQFSRNANNLSQTNLPYIQCHTALNYRLKMSLCDTGFGRVWGFNKNKAKDACHFAAREGYLIVAKFARWR